MKLLEPLVCTRFILLISSLILVSCENSSKPVLENEPIETHLKIGLSENIKSLVPYKISNNSEIFIATQVFEGFFQKNTEGQIIPQLVKNYSLDTIKKTFHFNFYKNKKFSDGSTLTTKDITNCFKNIIDDNNSSDFVKSLVRNIYGYNNYKNNSKPRPLPEGIEIIDEYTLSIKMKALEFNLIEALTNHQFWIYKNKPHNKIIGTGPFKVEHMDTDISLSLVRNNYYDIVSRDNVFKRINIRFIKNELALIDEFLKGSIDVIEYKYSDKEVQELEIVKKNKYGYKNFTEQTSTSVLYLVFHNFKNPEKIKFVLNELNRGIFLFKKGEEMNWLTMNSNHLIDTAKNIKSDLNIQDTVNITPISTIFNNATVSTAIKKLFPREYALKNTLNFTSFEEINPKDEYIVIKKGYVNSTQPTFNEKILSSLDPHLYMNKQNIGVACLIMKHDFVIFDQSISGFTQYGNWVKEVSNLTYQLPRTY